MFLMLISKAIHRSTAIQIVLAMLFAAYGTASAQTYNESISVSGGGTLTYQYVVETGTCYGAQETSANLWSNFIYTPSGGSATSLNAGLSYVYPCSAYNIDGGWNFTSDGNTINGASYVLNMSYGNCTIAFNATHGNAQGSASITCPPSYQGFISPKYVVVGVAYAPPGASSYVQYTNMTTVGNTTSISNSFQDDVGYSVSVQGGIGIPEGGIIDGGVKLTATESTDYTQGSNSSTTNTVSQTSTVAYKFSGTPSASPVNSDYDYILLWLNPELLASYTPPSGSNPASLQWTGYAFDGNDPASGLPPASGSYVSGPDIIEVQVGCLNGHISCPSTLTWLNNIEGTGSYVTSGLLARSWQSTANGYQWPSGEVPGLTFSDVCQILLFDPLSTTPSECPIQNNYTLLAASPSTTSDGRYTKAPYPPNVIQYSVGAPNESYSLVQTNTQSVSTGNSTQIKQAFSVSEEFGTNWLGIFSSTTTVKESQTLTWNYSTLNTLTTTNALTNALSITGPPDSPVYDGPVEFLAYQDNTFGTFVFVPVN